MSVLITGGSGYIGSHTYLELSAKFSNLIICDNLANSKIEMVENLETISKDNIVYKGNKYFSL